MCIIWLNMNIFSWRLVLIISLSLRDVITCALLHFPVSCWIEMASKNCWAVVVSFLPMTRIQTLILFLSGKTWFHGLLFVDREIYDMMWCSQYCVTMSMGLSLGGKLALNSNISYLIKGLSERSIFNVGRVEVFVTSISSPLTNLLLCSSNFVYGQYLSLLMCGFHQLIVALLFV